MHTASIIEGGDAQRQADRIEAERFIRETYDDNPRISRVWLANNRADLLRQVTQIVKAKREHVEHKARRYAEWHRTKLEDAA